MRQNPGRAITRYDICELSCKAYAKGTEIYKFDSRL